MNTNMQALFSTRVLGDNWAKTQQSQEKLSSGSRINRSGDDAAGLSISERNRASFRSLGQAARNLQDGFALSETANGALGQITDILTRLRELAIQSASDTNGNVERAMIDEEAQALREEMGRIARDTRYNDVPLLDGTAQRLDIQADANNDAATSRISVEPADFDVTPERLGMTEFKVSDKESARAGLEDVDRALGFVAGTRAILGSFQRRLETSRDNILSYRTAVAATGSRIKDTDVAEESSELVKNNIITHSNTAMLTQANQVPKVSLKLLA
jgi:flagellin